MCANLLLMLLRLLFVLLLLLFVRRLDPGGRTCEGEVLCTLFNAPHSSPHHQRGARCAASPP